MNYTTIAEFILYVGSNNMDDLMSEYSGSDVADRQEQLLNGAEGMLNAYAAKLWTIPLYASASVADPGIKEHVFHIAQFNLYVQMEGNDVPQRIKDSYLATLEFLDKLQKGEVVPPAGTDGTSPTVSSGGSSISLSSNDAVFNEENMEYY